MIELKLDKRGNIMIGAILGDIIGSTYEWNNVKYENFDLFPIGSRFTDDTVLSVAVADKILNSQNLKINDRSAYAMWFKQYYKRYPHAGFGQMFSSWANSKTMQIQRSFGNGAAMRISAIGFAFSSIKEIKREVNASCFYTHHNLEAIRGAQAIAISIFLAKKQLGKEEIKRYIQKVFKYHLLPLDDIRNGYVFDSRTSYSVPPAIEAFLESDSYETAIRKAISIGGDSDTIACMTGGIAQAYYRHIPKEIYHKGIYLLDIDLRKIIEHFNEKYHVEY